MFHSSETQPLSSNQKYVRGNALYRNTLTGAFFPFEFKNVHFKLMRIICERDIIWSLRVSEPMFRARVGQRR